MSSVKGFLWGLQEFLLTPICLCRMHFHLVKLKSKETGWTKKTCDYQRERQMRLQLRSSTSSLTSMDSTSQIAASDQPTEQNSNAKSVSCGIWKPLMSMWLINVGLILILALISHFIQMIPTPSEWKRFLSGGFHISLLLFMEFVNILYLKKICDRIPLLSNCKEFRHIRLAMDHHLVSSNKMSSNISQYYNSVFCKSVIGSTIMDRLYAVIFFMVFQLQWNLLANLLAPFYWLTNLINVFSVAFLYACYAFDYRWRQFTKSTFEGFLNQIVNQWTYFLGYGFTLGLLSVLFPHFIGLGGILLAFCYPLLVVGALGSVWKPIGSGSSLNSSSASEWRVFRLLRFVLIVSMRPALFISNLIVQTGAWVVCYTFFRS